MACGALFFALLGGRGGNQAFDQEQMRLTLVGGEHLEAETVDFDAFASVRHVFQTIGHHAAHRFAVVVFEIDREEFVELIKVRLGLDAPALVVDRRDVVFAEIDGE